jgi:hypothetical protein
VKHEKGFSDCGYINIPAMEGKAAAIQPPDTKKPTWYVLWKGDFSTLTDLVHSDTIASVYDVYHGKPGQKP